jgi:nifR3 family TIM-barrel protein
MTASVFSGPAEGWTGKAYHPVTIGSLVIPGNLFLAPVAGYSDRAFRALCIENGAAFTYTEMVSAEALVRESEKTHLIMRRAANEERYAVQLFGGDPERMALAVPIALAASGCECIDINAGCPVPKVYKTGAGSALTRNPEQLGRIVQAAVSACDLFAANPNPLTKGENLREAVPVTVKIRSGWDDSAITWKEAATAAIEAGAKAVTLHPRTRAQGYEGKSRWDLLAELVEYVRARWPGIPVFGSGDLFTPESAKAMLAETDCDAVMFARGAMGNPFIFRQAREFLETGAYAEIPADVRIASGWRELGCLVEDVGENVACREMRKRFCSYSKGIEGGAALRMALVKASTVEEYREILAGFGFSFLGT